MRRNRLPSGDRWRELNLKQIRAVGGAHNAHDEETAMFISMSIELKEEGNRLFLKRDYEGALIKYDKSIKLLPNNHVDDIAYIRSNMGECYMQLGINEYPMAIHECTLALEVSPNYTKALLKRARCYEALNRLDLALRDVQTVLTLEPNLMAMEIEQRLRKGFERQGSAVSAETTSKGESLVVKKIKSLNLEGHGRGSDEIRRSNTGIPPMRLSNDLVEKEEKKEEEKEKNTEDKLVVKEKITNNDEPKRTMKLVYGEDIRWAQVPINCDIMKLREIIASRYPNSRAVLFKYKDQEGDMVTITTTEELRWAEASVENGSLKLFIYEVSPDEDPLFHKVHKKDKASENESIVQGRPTCISDWIIQFAQFFKSYVGFDIDAYIDIHEVGIKLYTEAMEETVTSDEAQEIFSLASDKFVEMAALALFNCGNVHMSRARKRVHLREDFSREYVLEQIKRAYEWARKELITAGRRYEEALKHRPTFYEAVLALGQQQFEQAKLTWFYAIGTGVDLETWPSGEVLMLYNSAEENMERGMQIWEDIQQQRLRDKYKTNRTQSLLQRMKLDNLFKEITDEEIEDQATSIRSQIYVLWGTILYERSVMEFKLGVPVWHECLEAAIEKFELSGASKTDIGVMKKNHCSNDASLEGLGFNIDEIVQAWNDMYEAKKWQLHNISSFKLEPLLRRRISKLYQAFERL